MDKSEYNEICQDKPRRDETCVKLSAEGAVMSEGLIDSLDGVQRQWVDPMNERP